MILVLKRINTMPRRNLRNRRRDTIDILISNSIIGRNATHECPIIKGELNQIFNVENISNNNRKRILKILYSTRALDTTLRVFLDQHGIRNSGDFALGDYLKRLVNHVHTGGLQRLNESSRTKYQEKIVDKRNVYLHNAGRYPTTENEVNTILSEIDSCIIEIMNLET
jgi:hypothetical protein